MCTYLTERLRVGGCGKGPARWLDVTEASVYLDHPVAANAEHTLNLDFLNPELGPTARVALELDPVSAAALAEAIQAVLAGSTRAAQLPLD
ncbi:MAG: DUF6295 family protein [Candidatus Dormibacteria bacterium]